MKVFFCLLLCPVISLSQIAGNDVLYLNLYDIVNKDTVYIGKDWQPNNMHKDIKIKDGDYTIVDKGKEQYGFYKTTEDTYLHKVMLGKKNYNIEIIKKQKDTMRILFANFHITNYFLNIPFQKGSFIFSTPDENNNKILSHIFSFHRIEDKIYGFDISPKNWDAYKTKNLKNFAIDSFAIYKHTNYTTAQKLLYSNIIKVDYKDELYRERSIDSFTATIELYNNTVALYLQQIQHTATINYYGKAFAINDSIYLFSFTYGYQLASAIPNTTHQSSPSTILYTDTSTLSAINGIQLHYTANQVEKFVKSNFVTTLSNDNCTIAVPPYRLRDSTGLSIRLKYKKTILQTIAINKRTKKDILFFYAFDTEKHPWMVNTVLKVKINKNNMERLDAEKGWAAWLGNFVLNKVSKP
jgi:hypothetical protein